MADVIGLRVLREALRQGERVLAFQDQMRESVLRRASELLKLSVASLGGVIVVGGLISTVEVQPDPMAFVGFSVGVGLLVISTGVIAAALADVRSPGSFTHGPDPRRISMQIRNKSTTEEGLLVALLDAQPDWVEDNARLIERLQMLIAWSLVLLGMGAIALLTTLFYIVGGAILG